MDMRLTRRSVLIGGMAAALSARVAAASATRTIALETADGRKVSISHWRATGTRRGTILFSHGAASAPWKYERLIQPWADRGWEVFAPLHVDSSDHPDTKAFAGMKSWAARVEDMQLLSERLAPRTYVAAGHSYGGLTALVLGGAAAVVPEGHGGPLSDPKARTVLAFSPPPPLPGLISAEGYAGLAVPALIQTGTKDVPPGAPAGPDAWRGHLAAYDAARPGGDRYALVLEGVDHYFGGAICRPELPGPPQLAQLGQASALSLHFLDAYQRREAKARRALDAALADRGAVVLTRR
jgi:pimeloyl-ACP methyl ester carboxylesterase